MYTVEVYQWSGTWYYTKAPSGLKGKCSIQELPPSSANKRPNWAEKHYRKNNKSHTTQDGADMDPSR